MGEPIWKKSWEVFLPDIDEEHSEIAEAATEFEEALFHPEQNAEIVESFNLLVIVIEEHFAHEEKLMRTGNYDALEWHKKQHDTARKRIRQFAPLVRSGDTEAGVTLLQFLSSWFGDHTGLTDRMMGAFLRNRRRALVS